MDRTDFILLAIASGLVIVVIAMSFTAPVFSREMTKELCEDSDGFWNECGSLCTGEPPGTMCADVCVPVCECRSSFECPPEFYCRTSGIAGNNETGACRPFLAELCVSEQDCSQPGCPGMHSMCQDGECRTVNEMGALAICTRSGA
jgi:hypothetical protein